MKKFILAGAALAAAIGGGAVADQITVPHEFVAGQTARASEVNGNFAVLVQESNAQDVAIKANAEEIAALVAAFSPSSEQLICNTSIRWPTSPASTASECVSTMAPTTVTTPTFAQVLSEGWGLYSASAGEGSGQGALFVFRR